MVAPGQLGQPRRDAIDLVGGDLPTIGPTAGLGVTPAGSPLIRGPYYPLLPPSDGEPIGDELLLPQ